MKKNVTILLFIVVFTNGLAQSNPTIDSLQQLLKIAKHDTIKLMLLNELVEVETDDKIWLIYNKQLKSTAEKLLATHPKAIVEKIAKKYLAESFNNIGVIYDNQGDIPKALEYYSKSLQLREEIGDKQGTAMSLNNLGYIYYNQGDIPKALEYYGKSLRLQEKIGNKQGTATSLNNIGAIYKNQGDIPKALEYLGKSLQLQEEICDKEGIASSLNNIGVIYYNQGDIPKALEHYSKSLQLHEEIGDKQGTATLLNNIGFIYQNHGDPLVTSSKEDALRVGILKALEYYGKSLQLKEEIGDKHGIAYSLSNIGSIYLAQHQLTTARNYYKKAYQLSKELGYPELIEKAVSGLKKIYEQQGNFKLAYHYYQEEIQMRDSIQSEENYKTSVQQHAKYEYEKKAATDSIANVKEKEIKNSEIAQQKAEIKAKRFQQYGLIGGLAIVLIFAGFVYNRLKVTQQQKLIIETQKTEVEQQKKLVEKQKEVVEEKQNEILDSIRYAKRIQDAVLTPQTYIERNLKRLKNDL
ncbi:MAG: hypothetical protein A3K10_16990 [Bacteroidetes bacterium RIFCSPLOWO2_12_FULL_31_6]|nr:MAG: hypothetical protein A3K10_16990 [Bacteroidetes bacterium RIFCSPLOWO2_12_FULL_31_6]